MEEDAESPRFVVKLLNPCLLLPVCLVLLAACAPGSYIEERPTISASAIIANGDPEFLKPTSVQDYHEVTQTEFMGVVISYSDEMFGKLEYSSVEPMQAAAQNDALPERIEFGFSRSYSDHFTQLIVLPVDQYGTLSVKAQNIISDLRSILNNRPIRQDRQLPLLPLLDAIESFHSDPEILEFLNGRGIGFFILVDHDHDIMTNEVLFYTFQGLTDDDLYYVSLFIPLNPESKPEAIAERKASSDRKLALMNLEQHWVLPALHKTIQSLQVYPEEGFPTPTLPSYASFPGVLVAYDPETVKSVEYQSLPAIVKSPDGTAVFLADIPDMIRLNFKPQEAMEGTSTLTVQPIRDYQMDFYPSIPSWQQEQVQALESSRNPDSLKKNVYNEENFNSEFAFVSGFGQRQFVVAESNDNNLSKFTEPAYIFDGVTNDGRYLVRFEHVFVGQDSLHEEIVAHNLGSSAELQASLDLYDRIVQSLVINFDASTESSIPENNSDCSNDAEFLEDITIPDHVKIEAGAAFEKTWRVRNMGSCTWTPDYQVIQAGGNPLTWRITGLPGIVLPGEEANISIMLHSPLTPAKYHAWWQLTDAAGNPFGSFYSVLFESPKPATEIPGYGIVEGDIDYPAGRTPALIIYFLRTDESERYALHTNEGWTHFVNELPIGEYYVFARVLGDESDSGGGYTQAVKCGFKCEEHMLQKVVIEEGKATMDINIQDWYAPAGTFPLP